MNLDNKMIGGVVNFITNNDVILAFYISHDEAFQEYRPINLLFYEIVKDAINDNFKVLDFGIFTVNEIFNCGRLCAVIRLINFCRRKKCGDVCSSATSLTVMLSLDLQRLLLL